MPRILEALSHTEAKPVPVPNRVTCQTEAPATGEVVSFIEVGCGQLDGSPDVLAAPSQRGAAATAAKEGVRLVLHQPEPEAVGIRFRPIPPTAPSLRTPIAPELVAYHQPDHPVSGQYRALLPNVLDVASAARVLLFSGAVAGVGTTTVLLNLAVTAARQGHRVVLADADLLKPAIATRLGLAPAPGLFEVLNGLISLARALQETSISNLHALTAGEVGARPCWAVRSLGATLQQLRRRFDLVLVDGPAWSGGAENLGLASACDALYLVLPPGRAENPQTETLLHQLPRQGIPLRGCILAQR